MQAHLNTEYLFNGYSIKLESIQEYAWQPVRYTFTLNGKYSYARKRIRRFVSPTQALKAARAEVVLTLANQQWARKVWCD
jgi:hypothetical protein